MALPENSGSPILLVPMLCVGMHTKLAVTRHALRNAKNHNIQIVPVRRGDGVNEFLKKIHPDENLAFRRFHPSLPLIPFRLQLHIIFFRPGAYPGTILAERLVRSLLARPDSPKQRAGLGGILYRVQFPGSKSPARVSLIQMFAPGLWRQEVHYVVAYTHNGKPEREERRGRGPFFPFRLLAGVGYGIHLAHDDADGVADGFDGVCFVVVDFHLKGVLGLDDDVHHAGGIDLEVVDQMGVFVGVRQGGRILHERFENFDHFIKYLLQFHVVSPFLRHSIL
jgi:hypothetical protein